MIFTLTDQNTIGNQYIAQLRDIDIQKDRHRFRRNLRNIGRLLGYELSKTFNYESAKVQTPLGISDTQLSKSKVVLATILRAGLPLYEGLLDTFEEADSAFVSAYRKHHKDGSFDINMPYVTCPKLSDAILILADPMLATGASLNSCLESLYEYGTPLDVHIVTAIASQAGVNFIRRKHPKAKLWIGEIDEELTAKSYIVPGLGDAGDLAYGPKLQD